MHPMTWTVETVHLLDCAVSPNHNSVRRTVDCLSPDLFRVGTCIFDVGRHGST